MFSFKLKTTHSGIKFLFILVGVVTCLMAYSSLVQLRNLKQSNDWVSHTVEVKAELNHYNSIIKTIALKESGYLVTKNIYFLLGLKDDIDMSEKSLTHIRALTYDNKKYITLLDSLFDLNELVISQAIKNIIKAPIERDMLDIFVLEKTRIYQISKIIKRAQKIEDDILEFRKNELYKANLSTPATLVLLIVFDLLVLCLVYVRITKDLSTKQSLITDLVKNEDQLEHALSVIKANREELVNAKFNERFKLISDTMPQFIWTSDSKGELYFFSKSVLEYSGLEYEELISNGWLNIVHPDDREENIRLWMDSIKTRTPFNCEHRFQKHDGSFRWQLSRAVPVTNEEGNVEMWVGTSTDIHDQKTFQDELEKKVSDRTKKLNEINASLEKSNTDLAQYAFVASHDLQEPLRKIQTFTELLQQREVSKLSEKGKQMFKRIEVSAHRMQLLIRDILEYSKTEKIEMSDVNLNTIIETISQQYTNTKGKMEFKLSYENLPIIKAIPVQIEQIFSNLIGNSIKFQRKDIDLVISIHSQLVKGLDVDIEGTHLPNKDYYEITLNDNGIGFDNAFKSKLFQIFQRLTSREEYSGTGIGLALVKKNVETHQGYVNAFGEEGKGASFILYFPVG